MGAANLYLGHLRKLPGDAGDVYVNPRYVVLIDPKSADVDEDEFDVWFVHGEKVSVKNTTLDDLLNDLGFISVAQGVRRT